MTLLTFTKFTTLQLRIQIQLWIHIYMCVVPFEGPLHLQSQSHLCLALDYLERSTPDPDPALDPYLCCTFWGSILTLAPVPSMSHLRLCGRSTLAPTPVPSLSDLSLIWGVNSRKIWDDKKLGSHGGKLQGNERNDIKINWCCVKLNEKYEKSGVNSTFFCLQKSFCRAWLERLISFIWPMSQKPEFVFDVGLARKLVLYNRWSLYNMYLSTNKVYIN